MYHRRYKKKIYYTVNEMYYDLELNLIDKLMYNLNKDQQLELSNLPMKDSFFEEPVSYKRF